MISSGRLKGHKTIVVTGGLGFIGSHFIDAVLTMGHRVINIDCVTYAANASLKFVGEYTHVKEDISAIADLPFCDVVVNFAAESHVDNSIANPLNFIDTNVLGVHNLLEIIKSHKIKNLQTSWHYKTPLFVQISTDEVFGDILSGSFKEGDRHQPSNPYSATKSCAEQLVSAWGRTYDLPFMITRTTNNYGPRQHSEKLVAAAITRMLAGQRVIMHGDGRYVRNWLHVEDNVDALLRVVDSGRTGESYHIAADEEYSVKQIIEMVAVELGLAVSDVIDTSTDRSGCDERYALDCTKLKSELGWQQAHHFKLELPKMIEHYRKQLHGSSDPPVQGLATA